ncbi:hypothetical protein SpCBS45565_g07101 [Spizellomyces sp. 'palustris']|nr:hypothetical protein SpCBS45565_g07101 [Spizellomyces sp. 'palustris']
MLGKRPSGPQQPSGISPKLHLVVYVHTVQSISSPTWAEEPILKEPAFICLSDPGLTVEDLRSNFVESGLGKRVTLWNEDGSVVPGSCTVQDAFRDGERILVGVHSPVKAKRKTTFIDDCRAVQKRPRREDSESLSGEDVGRQRTKRRKQSDGSFNDCFERGNTVKRPHKVALGKQPVRTTSSICAELGRDTQPTTPTNSSDIIAGTPQKGRSKKQTRPEILGSPSKEILNTNVVSAWTPPHPRSRSQSPKSSVASASAPSHTANINRKGPESRESWRKETPERQSFEHVSEANIGCEDTVDTRADANGNGISGGVRATCEPTEHQEHHDTHPCQLMDDSHRDEFPLSLPASFAACLENAELINDMDDGERAADEEALAKELETVLAATLQIDTWQLHYAPPPNANGAQNKSPPRDGMSEKQYDVWDQLEHCRETVVVPHKKMTPSPERRRSANRSTDSGGLSAAYFGSAASKMKSRKISHLDQHGFDPVNDNELVGSPVKQKASVEGQSSVPTGTKVRGRALRKQKSNKGATAPRIHVNIGSATGKMKSRNTSPLEQHDFDPVNESESMESSVEQKTSTKVQSKLRGGGAVRKQKSNERATVPRMPVNENTGAIDINAQASDRRKRMQSALQRFRDREKSYLDRLENRAVREIRAARKIAQLDAESAWMEKQCGFLQDEVTQLDEERNDWHEMRRRQAELIATLQQSVSEARNKRERLGQELLALHTLLGDRVKKSMMRVMDITQNLQTQLLGSVPFHNVQNSDVVCESQQSNLADKNVIFIPHRKHLSMNQVYDFYTISTGEEALRYLASIVEIGDDPQRGAILLDFYYYNLRFAKDQHFSPEQASAFFSIMKTTHDKAMASPFINLDKDYTFFKDVLLHHSVHRPPYSQKVFSLAEVKAITEYAVNTYFRHYLMYKYAFTKKLRLELSFDNDLVNEEPDKKQSEEEIAGTAGLEAERTLHAEVSFVREEYRQHLALMNASQSTPEEKQQGAQHPVIDKSGVDMQQSEQTQFEAVGSGVSLEAPPVKELATAPEHADGKEIVVKETEQSEVKGTTPEVVGQGRPTPQEIAARELSAFVTATLSTKIDELRKTLLTRLQTQEDQINSKLRKIEEKEEERERSVKSKDAKGKRK